MCSFATAHGSGAKGEKKKKKGRRRRCKVDGVLMGWAFCTSEVCVFCFLVCVCVCCCCCCARLRAEGGAALPAWRLAWQAGMPEGLAVAAVRRGLPVPRGVGS